MGNSSAAGVQVCKMDFGGSHEGSSCGLEGRSWQFIRVKSIQLLSNFLHTETLAQGSRFTLPRGYTPTILLNTRTNSPAEEGRLLP